MLDFDVRWALLALFFFLACDSTVDPVDAGLDAFVPAPVDARVGLDARPDATPPEEDAALPVDDAGPSDAGPPLPSPVFVDVTVAAGLSSPHRKPATCIMSPDDTCEIDHMTGGAAVGDFDADGWPDLFVTNLEGPDHLYRNLGDGTFVDVAASTGLAAFPRHSNGAAFVDVDDDGDLDLYVTSIAGPDDAENGRAHLFIQDGGVFTEDAVARGAALNQGGPLFGGESVAVGDYDRDGYPDLHVTEWLAIRQLQPRTRLLRNRGAGLPGHYTDVTASVGALTYSQECWESRVRCSSYAFASAFTDLDDDGWQDLIVISDFGTSRVFWNQRDGTFEFGFRTSNIGGDENGMGSTVGDVDGDGDLDWFVSSIWDPMFTCAREPCSWGASGNRLFRNEGSRELVDDTDRAGVRESGWGWGAALFDYDNDGDLDLVAVNGVDFPHLSLEDAFAVEPMRFWVNDGTGRFQERSAAVGLTDTGRGKGLVVFDYDQDGDQDLFVVNNGALPRLYRNDGGVGAWLRLRLVGVASNTEALGARVEATVGAQRITREVGSPSHFLGQSEREVQIGLGRASQADEIIVRWPSGVVTRLTDVAAGQTLVVTEPDA